MAPDYNATTQSMVFRSSAFVIFYTWLILCTTKTFAKDPEQIMIEAYRLNIKTQLTEHLESVRAIYPLIEEIRMENKGYVFIPKKLDDFVDIAEVAIADSLAVLEGDIPLMLDAVKSYNTEIISELYAVKSLPQLVKQISDIQKQANSKGEGHKSVVLIVDKSIGMWVPIYNEDESFSKMVFKKVSVETAKQQIETMLKIKYPVLKGGNILGSLETVTEGVRDIQGELWQQIVEAQNTVEETERELSRIGKDLITAHSNFDAIKDKEIARLNALYAEKKTNKTNNNENLLPSKTSDDEDNKETTQYIPGLLDSLDNLPPLTEDEELKLDEKGNYIISKDPFLREIRYSRIQLKTARGSLDYLEKQEKKAWSKLLESRKLLAKKRKDLQNFNSKELPSVLRVRTVNATLNIDTKVQDRLAEIETHIAETTAAIDEHIDRIKTVRDELIDSAKKLEQWQNWRLITGISSAYMQAMTQGLAQIAETAVSSRGNKGAFVAAGLLQTLVNFLEWDNNKWFTAERTKDGKFEMMDIQKMKFTTRDATVSAGTTFGKTIANKVGSAEYAKLVASARDNLSKQTAVRAARTTVTAKLKDVKGMMKGGGSILGSITAGILQDSAIDGIKYKIAEFVETDSAKGYYKILDKHLYLITQMSLEADHRDTEEKNLKNLQRLRRNTLLGKGSGSKHLYRWFPSFIAEPNEAFIPVAGYKLYVDLESTSNPRSFSVYVAGHKLAKGIKPGEFLFTKNLVDALKEPKSSTRLTLKIVFQ